MKRIYQNEGISIMNQAEDSDLQRIENRNNQNKKQKSCYKLKEQKTKKNTVCKRWTNSERVRFITFLINYKSILESNDRVEKHGIFSKMSRFVETKNREACKTSYKQYFRRYRSIDGIIFYLKKIIHFNLEELKIQGQRMRQFIKKERDKQYNAVRGYNPKDFVMQNKPTFHFQPIISQIKLYSKSNKQMNDVGSEITPTNNNNQVKLQIPIEVVLIIQKKPSDNNGKEKNEQNQQKNNRFQLDDDQRAVRRKNYLIVDNSDFKDTFQQENIQIHKASIKQQIKQQSYLDQSHSQQKDQTIQEQSESQQIYQQRDEQEINQQEYYQYAQKQQDKPPEKRNGSKVWTMSEKMRLIIFIYINKQIFQSKDKLKSGILSKLCRYIGTDKTPSQCKTRLFYYRKKYNNSIVRIFEGQTKLLEISQDQIEKQKQKIQSMDDSEDQIMRCDIKIIAETIVHKIYKNVTDFDKKQTISQIFDLQLPLTVELNIVQQKFYNDGKESCIKLKEKQQNQSKGKLFQQEQREKGIYYESDSEQIKKSQDQNVEHKQITEVIIQQIQQEDSLISNCQYHGQNNTNCIRSKMTIYVNSKIFQMIKESFKQKAQKEKQFSLVNESNNYLMAEVKLNQLVQIIFTSKLSQNNQYFK